MFNIINYPFSLFISVFTMMDEIVDISLDENTQLHNEHDYLDFEVNFINHCSNFFIGIFWKCIFSWIFVHKLEDMPKTSCYLLNVV